MRPQGSPHSSHRSFCGKARSGCKLAVKQTCSELLLGSNVGAVAALSLSAVLSLGGKGGVALSADHFFALVLSGESSERGLNGDGSSATTSESEDQVEGGLLLDVVIAESATILKLLACEDQALLIGGNTFLILDLGLHVLNGIGGLNIQSDSLASEGLDEDLHGTAPKSEDQVDG